MNLMDVIDNIREDEQTDKGLTPDGIQFMRELLWNDRLIKSIESDSYQAIFVSAVDLHEGARLIGEVFFDKQKRFKDGSVIMSSPIESIEKIHHELHMVKTNNSTYLVVTE